MTESTDKPENSNKNSKKKWILLAVKLLFAAAMYWVIFGKIVGREGFGDVRDRLADLSWAWVAAAVAMQLIAIFFSTVRWQRLLVGQGIRASWRFLFGSIMIARYWGAFTPGGFTGFGGWRIYDVAKHTKKTARATATIGVEMILGQLAFGVVVMAGSIFGFEFIGTQGVLLVNGFFVALITAGLLLLSKPALFRRLAGFLPLGLEPRVRTLVDAVCAYQGKSRLLVQAAVLGMGTHAFNNLIYVCAARALGIDLSVGMVFFGSSLQIFATLIPASINGIGLRETAAVALYTAVGVAAGDAVLIPIVGFAAEMFVSAFGGLVFLARRSGYDPRIEVDDPDREDVAHAAIPEVPEDRWPKRIRGLTLGLGAGLLAGVIVGLGEASVVVASGGGRTGLGVLSYGAVAYGLFCGVAGAGLGLALAWSGRLLRREAMPEASAYGHLTATLVAGMALALGAFRVRRDVFHEELVWKSPKGLFVLLGCLVAAGLVYLLISQLLRFVVSRRTGAFMLKAWGSPAVVAVLVAVAASATLLNGTSAVAAPGGSRAEAAEGAPNVLFIVVDTLRADHLPAWGYEAGSTPHLDAFAADAVRFDQAFANASWTRPSFASFLTGRYPNNHGVMGKPDALPDDVVTLAESLRGAGYHSGGFVTNFNVGPYFNFQQGFDEYRFMEPDFVLGADDSAAKLLLIQFLRQRIETMRARRGEVLPGTAYRDAETVNAALAEWLDRAPSNRPWFLFAGYMDPHDPYFTHPYDGSGYARAAHPHPDPEEADTLRTLYDGEITYWDAQFGRLVEDLRRRGVYDDTLIVVTSDHGEEFHDHGGFWHGTTLYDEQVHVPLFVKLPGGRQGGTVVRHWVQSVDVMPTLLRELDVEVPDGVQGGDLFNGTDTVYAWENHEGNDLHALRERRGTDEIKLITANPGNPRGLAPIELFRVDLDPAESQDLASTERALVEQQTATLDETRRRTAEGAIEARQVDLDAESAERLRAIGYATDE